jgi:hypothetical protein
LAIGTVSDPVPVTGLAANFSPIPRIAPPPLGNETCGAISGAGPGVAPFRSVSGFCAKIPLTSLT